MKLLCFVMLLISWRLPFIQNWVHRFPLLSRYVDFLDKLFGERGWYSGNAGLLLVLAACAIILQTLSLACGNGLLGFIFQSVILIFAIQLIGSILFSASKVEFLPHAMDAAILNELPSRVWEVNYRIVTPLFWYMFFGVLGLMAYMMLAYLQQNSRWQMLARTWLEIACWLPARVLSFAYAVAGNFSQGLKIMAEFFAAGAQYNQYLLQNCALASLMRKDNENIQVNIDRLVRDALILLAGLYALAAMLGWLVN